MPPRTYQNIIAKQEIHSVEKFILQDILKVSKLKTLNYVLKKKIEKVKILKIEGIQSQEWLEEKYKESLRAIQLKIMKSLLID